jgi:hypothetical protein
MASWAHYARTQCLKNLEQFLWRIATAKHSTASLISRNCLPANAAKVAGSTLGLTVVVSVAVQDFVPSVVNEKKVLAVLEIAIINYIVSVTHECQIPRVG